MLLYEAAIGCFLFSGEHILVDKYMFKSPSESLSYFNSINRGEFPEHIRKLILDNVTSGETLYVSSEKVAKVFSEIRTELSTERFRAIKERLLETIGVDESTSIEWIRQMTANGNSEILMDVLIEETIELIDGLEKDINEDVMRLKCWYSFHFPELSDLDLKNEEYVDLVNLIGNRSSFLRRYVNQDLDRDNNVIRNDLNPKIIRLMKESMGVPLSNDDSSALSECSNGLLKMIKLKKGLVGILEKRMETVAPNLTTLVGTLVGARLISKAGGLGKLANLPASTIQVMGAERALFRALRMKESTPKYGFIYYSPILSKCATKIKGKIARTLAAKASLAAKIDSHCGNSKSNDFGLKEREKIEKRIKILKGTL